MGLGCSLRILLLSAVLLVAVHAWGAEGNRTEGKIAELGKESLVVVAADGERMAFHAGADNKLARIALEKALRVGLPIVVIWHQGEERRLIDKLEASGTLTGKVVEPRKQGLLSIQVEGIAQPVSFVARWIKQEDKWVPDPEEVKRLAGPAMGSTIRVTYVLEEHLRVNAIEVTP